MFLLSFFLFRAIFELAVTQSDLDTPELVWKAYIDFEIGENEIENARKLYERLLEKSSHIKVRLRFFFFFFLVLSWGLLINFHRYGFHTLNLNSSRCKIYRLKMGIHLWNLRQWKCLDLFMIEGKVFSFVFLHEHPLISVFRI